MEPRTPLILMTYSSRATSVLNCGGKRRLHTAVTGDFTVSILHFTVAWRVV